MTSFDDSVAVITGAASGIGRGLAEHCLQRRIKVVLGDIEAGALAETAADLDGAGGQVHPVRVDVADAADVERLAEEALAAFGRVDLLFCNAGVAAGGALWESTTRDCDWVMGVNLWGVIHCIRSFVPRMLAQGTPGHIVNTASVAGLFTFHPSALYHLSKHAVVSLSEQLQHDLRLRGAAIGVSILCPGFVNTRIMDAERNRPVHLQNDPDTGPPSHGGEESEALFRRMVAAGLPPARVAEQVFTAISEERFLIHTHPELEPYYRDRLAALGEGRLPDLPPPPKAC
ncbi:MAG: SDR family NAD(P)-dependent oxidoreductase [Desulfosarcinaceae bacterium]|nr:SDR family NAD(P)-dependent oxidoreductase [Desulfosarcinaceae bacterium]